MASSSEENLNTKLCRSSDEEQLGWMDRLPREVQFRILARLPILSLLECKLVSRLWHASLKEPEFTIMHLQEASANDDPCLIIFSDRLQHKLQLIADLGSASNGDSVTAKVLNTPFESTLPRFDLVGSSNGLVCLYNYIGNDPLYVYNPFTIEYRTLPELHEMSQPNSFGVVFGFGFVAAAMAYKAVKIMPYRMNSNVSTDPAAFILTVGTSDWRKIGNIPYRLFSLTSEAEVNGKLHWLTNFLQNGQDRYRDIVSLDLTTEEFHIVPRPSCGSLDKASYHLVTLQGCLSAIVAQRDRSNDVWMMKDYNVQASWTKQFTIGDCSMHLNLNRNMAPPGIPMKSDPRTRGVRVLCALKNGEILILYRSRWLVCYNSETQSFRNLNIQRLPMSFLACVHVGSLISPDTIFGIQRGD